MDDQTCAVVVQHPNFFGCLEEVEALAAVAQSKGAMFVVSFDPISLGVLKRPGQYGADIAVAEGQCLGNPLVYGGPYLGILACREKFVRKMPGRLVGETVDRQGKRCWVLTLQTREQHIRREKSDQQHLHQPGPVLLCGRPSTWRPWDRKGSKADRGTVYPQGALRHAEQLTRLPGVSLRFQRPFFKEFTLRMPTWSIPELLSHIARGRLPRGPAPGPLVGGALDDCMSLAVTEKRSRKRYRRPDGRIGTLSHTSTQRKCGRFQQWNVMAAVRSFWRVGDGNRKEE